MKKVIITVASIASYLTLATNAFADNICAGGPFDVLCKVNGNNIGGVLGTVIQAIFIFAIMAALIYLIWGGFKWLISGGDKSAVGAAREHIIAAIVGLVIIFLSYFILNFLIAIFVPNFHLNNFTIPPINPQ